DVYRRLYLLQYIPPGFWPRLTTRLLNDDKLAQIISGLFVLNDESLSLSLPNECALYADIMDALNTDKGGENRGGFDFLLWQTGVETNFFGQFLMSIKQFLPLANVRDTNYSVSALKARGEDGIWRKVNLESDFLLELLVPFYKVRVF
uniref:HECT domain-containing protein n=1 Tax=Bursaphelenchus xylophilus TaxID=6326 RepID=A0A1I7SKV9_BURXY